MILSISLYNPGQYTIKRALCLVRTYPDVGKLAHALLQYRNMPSLKDRLSPAQKLYGHPIQDTLPAHHCAFAPEWQCSITEAEDRGLLFLEQVELYYNRPFPTSMLCKTIPLRGGTYNYGVVVEIGPNRRYSVRTNGGRVLICNHRFLRRRVPQIYVSTYGHMHARPRRLMRLLFSKDFSCHTQRSGGRCRNAI